MRESPGVRIAKALSLRGADVVLHDPLVRFDAVRDEVGPCITQVDDVTAAATGADSLGAPWIQMYGAVRDQLQRRHD